VLRNLPELPDEVEMTFALQATGEGGNFAVAKGSVGVNYTITLTWRSDRAGS